MFLTFDFSSDTPLYLQIRNQVVIGIAQGQLAPGEKLPTIRALAEESGINMMTVSKAYQILKSEGYITTDRRSGAVIAPRKEAVASEENLAALKLALSELRLSGMSTRDAMALCKKLYEEGTR